MCRQLQRLLVLALIVLLLTGAASSLTEILDRPLRKGQSGEAVVQLQRRLIELGYLHDRADGKFGIKTGRAVYAFQRRTGLKTDSVANADTLAALFDEAAPEVTVFVAPSGKRYHARANCRGLGLAKSTEEIGYAVAISKKRTPCILCYGRFALRLAVEALEAEASTPEASSE